MTDKTPSMGNLRRRSGQETRGIRKLKREFARLASDGTIDKTEIEYASMSLSPMDLKDILRSPKNVRRFSSNEFTERPYFEDIKATGIIQDHISLYKFVSDDFEGDSEICGHQQDQLYIADGFTRKMIAEYLYEQEGDDHRVITVPAHVYKLKEKDAWVVDRLRDLSDSNQLFSWLEDSLRIGQYYSEFVQDQAPISGRAFQALVEEKSMRAGTYNRNSFKLKLTVSFIAERLISILGPKTKELNDVKGDLVSSIYRFLVEFTGNDLNLYTNDALDSNLINLSKNIWDDGLNKLEELADSIQVAKDGDHDDGVSFSHSLKGLIKKTLSTEKPKASTNNDPKPPVQLKTSKNGCTAKAALSIKSVDFEEANYAKAVTLLESLKASIEEQMKAIEALKKSN